MSRLFKLELSEEDLRLTLTAIKSTIEGLEIGGKRPALTGALYPAIDAEKRKYDVLESTIRKQTGR